MTPNNDSIPPSMDLGQRVERLERNFSRYVGSQPDIISGGKGSGLIQAVVDLGERLDALASVVQADIAARKAEADARARGREPWSKAAWIAIGSAIGVVTSSAVGGALLWVLHR